MSDLEQRLEEVFATDARARRVERVHVDARRGGGVLASAAFLGAVSLAVVAAIVVISTLRPTREDVTTAAPSGLPSATASAAPSASPASGKEYVNSTWGYAVTLPEPYRRSERYSFPASPGLDRFTALTAQAESDNAPACHYANCFALNYTALVWFESGAGTMSARDFYAAGRAGQGLGQRLEDVTVAGRPALKVEPGVNDVVKYIVPDGRGGMFVLSYQIAPQFPTPDGASEDKLRAILSSFRFITVGATPSATPAAAARPEKLLGYISHGSGGALPILRSEADATPIRTFPSEMRVAATRDGRRVAYVRTGQTGQQLLVFDTARPTQERTVLDLSGSGEEAGGLVWATDADEVLLAVHKIAGTGGAKEYSRLVAVDMASGRTREIYRSTSGLALEPLAWRAATATAAAIETGPGGYAVTYVHLRGATATRHAMEAQVIASSVRASPDGERVVQVDLLGRAPTRGVTWWPAARYDERQRIALSDHDVSVALWRPGVDELVVFVTPSMKTTSPGPRIERWSLAGAKRMVREIGAPPAVVRVDGSAVITTGGMLVDLETGDATPIPGARNDLWPRVAVAF